ncbi:MAG: hypothetical protein R8K22_01795 [Mariprofundaceae bacterium]
MALATLTPISIPKHDFDIMHEFARVMYRLKNKPEYLKSMAGKIPEAAGIQPDAPSMLMGFDFHLTADGPKLIEINNNASGLYIDQEHGWLPQPENIADSLSSRLLKMFPEKWQTIAIMDEEVEQQYMYPEMCAYAALLRVAGRKVFLLSPEDLSIADDGLYVGDERIDVIYNRHTDFYLESDALTHVRHAYFNGLVQLNPHPRSYALLGDKSRMADWWHTGLLETCVDSDALKLIRSVVPEIHLLSECDLDQAWAERKKWVFKPTARHGGKGVLLGKSMSRKRFNALDIDETVMQTFVPASVIQHADEDYKFDFRLFMQGEDIIAIAGRLWRGQVTNFRTEGSGWVPISIAG